MRRPPARWNSSGHDGPGCFNADQTLFYFTRCQGHYCQIYTSELRNGKWQSPTPLGGNVNAPESNSKHPTLSAGGDTLYFVSDRAGGYGGTDIWMSVRHGSTGWQPPQNLGESLNTFLDEMAPFYYAADDLFLFASRGHGGPGGMDLYGVLSFTQRPGWVPVPLPSPFNVGQDDCFLTMGHRRGFLSSNRSGNFDIYQFMVDSTRTLTEQLFGNSFLSTQARPSSFSIASDRVLPLDVSLRATGEDIITVRSVPEERLSNGSSRFILSSDVNDIALQKLREQSSARPLPNDSSVTAMPPDTWPTGSEVLLSVQTSSIPTHRRGEVSGSLYSEKNQQTIPTARATVHLLDSIGQVVKISTTNEAGKFQFVNLAPNTRYTLVLADPVSDRAAYQVEGVAVKESEATVTSVPYETLYFDFNQSSLRPEAQQSLIDLAAYVDQHPQTSVEINAFADSLGNDAYNLQLSRQRGESVFVYLLQQGVDRDRLAINAQGVSTTLSSTNSLVSQQLNRRVEIQLIGENVTYEPQAEVRILRPGVALPQLYRLEGVAAETLRRLNGQEINQLRPLKPLRVPVLDRPGLDSFFFDIHYQE